MKKNWKKSPNINEQRAVRIYADMLRQQSFRNSGTGDSDDGEIGGQEIDDDFTEGGGETREETRAKKSFIWMILFILRRTRMIVFVLWMIRNWSYQEDQIRRIRQSSTSSSISSHSVSQVFKSKNSRLTGGKPTGRGFQSLSSLLLCCLLLYFKHVH